MNAAQRKRPAWGDAVVILLVLALAVITALILHPAPDQPLYARITLDGTVLGEYELSRLDEPLLIPIDGPYPLTLCLSREGAAVIETSCPGQDCLHTGTVSRSGGQLICLPNRLVVALSGPPQEYDAILG